MNESFVDYLKRRMDQRFEELFEVEVNRVLYGEPRDTLFSYARTHIATGEYRKMDAHHLRMREQDANDFFISVNGEDWEAANDPLAPPGTGGLPILTALLCGIAVVKDDGVEENTWHLCSRDGEIVDSGRVFDK